MEAQDNLHTDCKARPNGRKVIVRKPRMERAPIPLAPTLPPIRESAIRGWLDWLKKVHASNPLESLAFRALPRKASKKVSEASPGALGAYEGPRQGPS